MRIKLLFVLLLGSFAVLQAQMLWEVSTRNAKKSSYIIGTHELIPACYLDSIPDVYNAFNRCDVVISNVNMNTIDENSKLNQYALIPENENIRSYLSDADAILLDTIFKRDLQMNLLSVGRFHPLLITNLLQNALFIQANKLKDDIQSDAFFQQHASAQSKQVIGLESSDQVFRRTFQSSTINAQVELLVKNCLRIDSMIPEMKKLANFYKQNKLKQTNNELVKIAGKTDIQPLDQTRLAKLTGLMRANRCFYVADIRQLYGGNSILEQLRKAGFTVQPFLSKNSFQLQMKDQMNILK